MLACGGISRVQVRVLRRSALLCTSPGLGLSGVLLGILLWLWCLRLTEGPLRLELQYPRKNTRREG